MSFLDEVRAKRKKLADVLSDEDYSGIREIVEELYPDRAHFIYELLQNAEDTHATEAVFELGSDSVSFEHNGRPFNEEDVWGITNIGKGTKRDQPDQIGTFGVGFKAVFGYSETPHIWSPTFSFKISDLVLPTELVSRADLGRRTRFEFPFNNPKKCAQLAYQEVHAGLEELAETTLLFLSHLKSIRWHIDQKISGEVRRIQHSDTHIEVLKSAGTQTKTSSHVLRFSQAVNGFEKQHVSIAFPLDCLPDVTGFDSHKPLAEQLKIIPATPGSVAVFFPAEKETSGLRFHLHAPFVPELSRASIKETPANDPLFSQLARLAAASLHNIRDLGLLNGEFLAVLPNPNDSIPARYELLRSTIIDEMNNQPLTPTYSKSHAPARTLVQAKASVKELLSPTDLSFLIDHEKGEPPQWAVAAPQKNSNIDRFLTALDITEWDIDELISTLSLKASHQRRFLGAPHYKSIAEPDAEFMSWLAGKSTSWHQHLYALIHAEVLSRPEYQRARTFSELGELQILRLSDGRYSIGRKCYFPADGIEEDAVFPRVDEAIYSSGKNKTQQQDAKSLLEKLGVREVGETEQVQALLQRRYTAKSCQPDLHDLERFIALVEAQPATSTLFAEYHVFKRADGKWGTPSQVYLDSPFQETGLSAYYDALGVAADKGALSRSYQQLSGAREKIGKFAQAVGVQVQLELKQVSCSGNPSATDLIWSAPGGWSYSYGINRDYTVQGLDELLSKPNEPLSRLVWNTACQWKDTKWFRAQFRNNSNYSVREAPSQLVCTLRNRSWIPQTDGRFVRPAEASRNLLPKGFPFDEGFEWLKVVGFGEQERQRSEEQKQQRATAKELGFADAESLARAKQFAALPLAEQERILCEYRRHQDVQLPEHEPRNPERRAKLVEHEARNAPVKTTEERMRSVSVGRDDVKQQAAQYLQEQYTIDGEMICQACKASLPFKLADGSPYFEKIECFEDLKRRHFQNYLALCPNHGAMFQHANNSWLQLKAMFIEMQGNELQVVLAQENTGIYFTKTHIADLRKVLEVESAEGGDHDCANERNASEVKTD